MGYSTGQIAERLANPNIIRLFQSVDDPLCGLDHGFDPRVEGVVRMGCDGKLIERYINGEVGVCLNVHSSFPALDFKSGDLLFVFQNNRPRGPQVLNFSTDWFPHQWKNFRRQRAKYVQLPMPVLTSQVSNKPKGTVVAEEEESRFQGGSVVGLYEFNNFLTLRREWRDLLNKPFYLVGLDGFVFPDRELQAIRIGDGRTPAVFDGRGIYSTVKSSTELIDHLAKEEADFNRNAALSGSDKDESCPIILYVGTRSIGVAFKKGIPRLGHIVTVGLCTLDSFPNTFEGHEDNLQQLPELEALSD